MAAFDFAKVKDPTFFKENVLNAHASSILTLPAKNIGQAPLLWR